MFFFYCVIWTSAFIVCFFCSNNRLKFAVLDYAKLVIIFLDRYLFSLLINHWFEKSEIFTNAIMHGFLALKVLWSGFGFKNKQAISSTRAGVDDLILWIPKVSFMRSSSFSKSLMKTVCRNPDNTPPCWIPYIWQVYICNQFSM